MANLSFELRCAADRLEGLGHALDEVREMFRVIQESLSAGDVARAEILASIGWQFAEMWDQANYGTVDEIRKVIAGVSHA